MGNVQLALRAERTINNMKPTQLATKYKQQNSICSSLTLNRTEIKSLQRNTADLLLNQEKFITPDFVQNSPNFKTYIDNQLQRNQPQHITQSVNELNSCSTNSLLCQPQILNSSTTRPGTAVAGVTKNEHIQQRALANQFLRQDKYINKQSLTKKEFLLLDQVLVDSPTTEQKSIVQQKFQAQRDQFIEKQISDNKSQILDSEIIINSQNIILSSQLSLKNKEKSKQIVGLNFSASLKDTMEHQATSDLVQEQKAYNLYFKRIYFFEGEKIMRDFQIKVYSVYQGLFGFRRRFIRNQNKFYNKEMRIYQGDDDLSNIITDLQSAYSSELNKVTKLKNAEIRFQQQIAIIQNIYTRILQQIDQQIQQLRVGMQAKLLLNEIYSRCDLWENSKELIEKEQFEQQIINELAQLSQLSISQLQYAIDQLTSAKQISLYKANTRQSSKLLLEEVKYELNEENQINTALVDHNQVKYCIQKKLLDDSLIIRDQQLLKYCLTLNYNRMVPEQFNLPLLLKDSIIAVNKLINSDIIWLLSQRLIKFKHPYFQQIYQKVDPENFIELQKQEERRKRVVAMFAKLHQKGILSFIIPKSMKTVNDDTIMKQKLFQKIIGILQPKYNNSMLSLSPIDKLLVYIECKPFTSLQLNFPPLFTTLQLNSISNSIHPIIQQGITILNESRMKPIILFQSPQHCLNAIRDASYETAQNFVTRQFLEKPTIFIQNNKLKKWQLAHSILKKQIKQLTLEVNNLNGLYQQLEYQVEESKFSQLVWKEAMTKQGLFKQQNEIDFTKTINSATSNLAYDTDKFDSISMLQTQILTDKLEILNVSMNSIFQHNPVFMQKQQPGIEFGTDMMLNICNAKFDNFIEQFERYSKEQRERARIVLRRRQYFRTVNQHQDVICVENPSTQHDQAETMEQFIIRRTHESQVKLNYPAFQDKRPTVLSQLVIDQINKRINDTTEEKGFYDFV